MSLLHEVIAVEGSKKNTAETLFDEALKQFKNNHERYNGFSRRYEPHTEDGEKLPPEEKGVQDTVKNKLNWVFAGEADYVDVALTKETTNQLAKADVIVDGEVLVKDIPATALLFLEKRLAKWLNLITAIPTLDSAEEWSEDENTGLYVSKERSTVREKKELRWEIVTPATKEHKAQYEKWMDTVPVGNWVKKSFSGCLTVKEKAEMINRLKSLSEAVIAARMRANTQKTENVSVGDIFYKFVIGQA